ncbi:TIGR04283 family arsenosugar biosynthesis glycosyltransferase [Pontibacter sp. SGAir0037]|uniref:TIGR04283 family arsenosugar biosynthesis glycosyltransferase n=1 Tax=Pontibacter sp. SGAir0037 TaxID=2571030 RepID=UPI0010CD5CB0|nr:TIGR04283 family arsenosugar biosynthesis glycosyltransferase [Pontibacter sp. SGAir0037]QCR24706.1 hypothetical protein C1N53_21700 [Pontibacter sp. SGAir0037]
MKLSIIIPTLNEEASIGEVLHYLRQCLSAQSAEIIVADGGSLDQTVAQAEAAGARVVSCGAKGRAVQMNAGARAATGDVLYFLHADTYPSPDFYKLITESIGKGYKSGCFRLKFDDRHWFLRLNAWFTRFDVDAIRFGDQSLFVERVAFSVAGGFDEKHLLLEDQEIIKRLKKLGKFTVLKAAVVTSARKYRQQGVIRLQAIYYLIYTLYRLGWSQPGLVRLYKKLLGRSS